jgi:hypothetical protein
MAVSQSNPVMNPGAGAYYDQQLALNLNNYNNIQGQYQEAQSNASNQLSSIYQGYGSLSQSVLNMLGVGKPGDWGVATPASQQIQRQYEQSQGQNQQSLINAGLGNSTLLSNVMNQGNLQAAQAYGNLGAQLAQTAAGYTSQIGLAGLQAQQQGVNTQLGFAGQHEGTLGRFNFAPNINLYGQSSYSNSGGGGGSGGYGGGSGGMGPSAALGQGAQDAYQAFNQNNSMGYQGGYNYGGQPSYSQAGQQPTGTYMPMSNRDKAGWNLADSSPNWENPNYFNSMWDYAEG